MQQINKAMADWIEYKKAQTEGEKLKDENERREEGRRWVPLRGSCIKINTNAAPQKPREKVGWGMVPSYEPMLFWALPQNSCSEPMLEEALAVRTTMVKAKMEGWTVAEFQSDCESLIKKIQEEGCDNALCAMVLEDIASLKEDFVSCHFSFVRRVGNVVSHMLAKFAINLCHNVCWKVDFPI